MLVGAAGYLRGEGDLVAAAHLRPEDRALGDDAAERHVPGFGFDAEAPSA